MNYNDHTEELKAAYELGLSDGEFGDNCAEAMPCWCQKCQREYRRGFDEGLQKLLGQVKP